MNDPIIRIENVSRVFGGVRAVDNVSLTIDQGEFFALVGPSGCGKTTLLRMLAGFETPSEGRIIVAGQDMSNVAPNKRPINMVFQSYAVFPHMSVAENIGYGLKMENRPAKEIAERAEEALSLVKLTGLGNRRPDQLSGGQRQRVALARALVKRPQVLLLDEPLSALDAKLREAMQLELVHLQKTVGITFVIVTHDQAEALSMANRIAVMERGAVRQVAGPSVLYEAPNCRFVADFIGKINLFDADATQLSPGVVRVSVPRIGDISLAGTASGRVGLAVRPEKISVSAEEPVGEGLIRLRGTVADIAYYGGYSNVFVNVGLEDPIMADFSNASRAIGTGARFAAGDTLWCSWRVADTLLLSE